MLVGRGSGPARSDTIRSHNLTLLLGNIHRDGPLSRAALTQRLGFNRSTVGTLVAELSELGLVEETVPSRGAGVGRPSHVVGPRAGGPYVFAVDIDVHELVLAAVGFGGTVLQRFTYGYSSEMVTPEEAVACIGTGFREITRRLDGRGWLAGVGVSVPGTVRRSDGRILLAPNLAWHDVAIDQAIAREIGWTWPVHTANDADLGALAEHLRGAARGVDDVLFVAGRVGVGGGVISGGRPLHGATGMAGEIGHVGLDPAGPLCHCGNRGCLETFVGESAFIRLSGRTSIVNGSVVKGVVDAAAGGDERAEQTVQAISESLGRGLAYIASVLDPRVIVVGGFLAVLFDAQDTRIRSAFDATMGAIPKDGIDIRRCGLGRDSALIGAAEVGFATLLEDPVGTTTALLGLPGSG